jgi:hypothetical protein
VNYGVFRTAIVLSILLLILLVFQVVDGYRRFSRSEMEHVTLKSEYLFSTVVVTIIFTALMATNVAQFYKNYKDKDPNSRKVTVVYTPINISSSAVLSTVTILLVILLYSLISL